MTDFEYDKETQEVIAMVNDHYAEIHRPKSKYEMLKKKVISRISGKKEPMLIISFNLTDVEDRYAITTSGGQNVGIINIGTNIKTKMELVRRRPVYKIYKSDVAFYEYDVLNNLVDYDFNKYQNQEVISDTNNRNQPVIDSTRIIFELIESQDYDNVEKYIVLCMEKLIAKKDVDVNPNFRDIFESAQKLIRNIHRKKTEISDKIRIRQDYSKEHKELDFMYREICILFINYGMYELPDFGTEEIVLK